MNLMDSQDFAIYTFSKHNRTQYTKIKHHNTHNIVQNVIF